MPRAITQKQHDHARNDAPALWQMAGLFIGDWRQGERLLAMPPGDFLFEPFHHRGGVEAVAGEHDRLASLARGPDGDADRRTRCTESIG